MAPTEENPNPHLNRLAAPIMEMFGVTRGLAVAVVLLCAALVGSAIYWFVHSAPPDTIIITSGAKGSSFESNANKYSIILAKKGIRVKILPSQGSLQNLQRLNDPSVQVDVGFVQGGVTNDSSTNTLVSLGSITYEPLLVFYRSAATVDLLSGFAGQRVAIGSEGSGTRSLALQMFALNGIKPGGATHFEDLDGDVAGKALMKGTVDAAFLMSDSTSINVLTNLLNTPGVRLFNFVQADAYTRRISYLNKLVLPEGSIDFARNFPAADVNLVGPAVEIIARPTLHPALSDLVIEAAQETNSGPGLFKRRHEFPAPIEHDFPISSDASRYYTSGKKGFYKVLPFWLASAVSRLLVACVPLIVIIPAIRIIPSAFKWRMQTRINRWYRELLALERRMMGDMTPGKHHHLATQLDHIENAVNKMKVPASFADQFYNLRGHIQFVRQRLMQSEPAK